jgi:hypothetical protein
MGALRINVFGEILIMGKNALSGLWAFTTSTPSMPIKRIANKMILIFTMNLQHSDDRSKDNKEPYAVGYREFKHMHSN